MLKSAADRTPSEKKLLEEVAQPAVTICGSSATDADLAFRSYVEKVYPTLVRSSLAS
jgi:hypothetical protein